MLAGLFKKIKLLSVVVVVKNQKWNCSNELYHHVTCIMYGHFHFITFSFHRGGSRTAATSRWSAL